MMTSANSSFPARLTKIDDLTRGDHHYLNAQDACYFLGEYTARAGFSHSATNHLIINFKKPMDRRGTPQWPYKAKCIRQAGQALHQALSTTDLRPFTFVPVPPSKSRQDPLYDDRMMQMLGHLGVAVAQASGYVLDVRELVTQHHSTEAAHDGDNRPSPDELILRYRVENAILPGVRQNIVICDDVLTTGSHYRAMCSVLGAALPTADFRGLFLARRAPQAIDFSALFDQI